MPPQPSKLVLHSRLTSSCSARVRIAASLKNIPLEIKEYNLPMRAPKLWRDAGYQRLNPNATVPTLEAHYEQGEPLILTQSLSMLEFLEDTYSDGPRLIPPVTDMAARCKARDLALLVAADFQPLQTARTVHLLQTLPTSNPKVLAHFMDKSGLVNGTASNFDIKLLRQIWTLKQFTRYMEPYEAIAKESAGQFSVGDNVSIADICLVTMAQSLKSLAVRFSAFPTIARIIEACENIDAFRLQGVPVKVFEERGTSQHKPATTAQSQAEVETTTTTDSESARRSLLGGQGLEKAIAA